MSALTRFAIRNARLTWFLVTVVTVSGIGVFLSHPRQEDPEIQPRNAQIVTRLPGLSPERIEQLVTLPVEETVKTIAEIDEIQSISMNGVSIVSPEIGDQHDDMDAVWADLRNKIDDLKGRLPEGVDGPHVNDDYGRVAVITLALTGDDFSMAELHSAGRDLRDALGALELVARVDLHGIQSERIWIEFDAASLAQYGLDPRAIVTTLAGQNIALPGGTVVADGVDVVVEPSGEFRSLDDIRRVAISSREGGIIYLEDIARVRRGYQDPPSAPAYHNGKPAIVLALSMIPKANVVALGEQVRAELEELRPTLPLGMNLEIVIFQPDLVEAAVNDASSNLLQTIIVVLVVVMLFLGLRTGLIVGAMVPLTIMVTLIGMSVGGIELHRVSIAAIIVALGLLVDNGVVIAEDIKKRLDEGVERFEATLQTTRTLAVPLLTSSLTTVAAFLPLMTISGGSGEFLKSLGQVLTMALLSSWFIAITAIPAFCYWALSPSKKGKKPVAQAAGPRKEARVYGLYRRFLGFILGWRGAVVAVMILLLISAMAIFSGVRQRSLGPSERNQFTVYVDLPAYSSIHETIGVTARLSEFLEDPAQNPEVTDVLAYVGAGGPRFFLALAPNDPQPNKAFLVVNTNTAEDIETVMPRVSRFLVERCPEANGRAEILFLGAAPPGTVEFRVTGPEIDVLRETAARLTEVFHSVPGTVGVRDDWESSVLKLRVEVDQERSRRAGVTSQEIANTLSAHFDGTAISTYREADVQIPIAVRALPEDRGTLDRVRTIEVVSAGEGKPVPMLQIANFEGEVGPSRIRRFDQQRSIVIAGKHPEMTAKELFALLKPRFEAVEKSLPRGYELEIEGEIKDAAESNGKLFRYAPHAFMLILFLMILQFNSFRRPFIILSTIPLVLIGANYGLFLFGGFFDFTAMLGLFSLAGIIINNGIVLIDRIDEARKEGMGVQAAVMDAALARARPILMTTVTTVVGLIPLALFGGEFWYGMAIVIMCGLGVGSVLTLAYVPVLYSLLFDFHRRSRPDRTTTPQGTS